MKTIFFVKPRCYRLFSAVVILLALNQHALGQQNQQQMDFLKSVVPPSPNAAALAKYGLWPVNLYTGVPSVDIPLYELKGRSLSVPIGLSYHASGIHVSEIASWVGLGWSLQAGGVISRTVRSLPDEEAGVGYFAIRQHYSNPADLSSSASEANWKNDAVQSAKAAADSEHDVYTMSALGKSFKLLFKADGTVMTAPYSNVKITANFTAKTWSVILEDGTKLLFGGTGYYELTSTDFGTLVGALSYPSSWYLKSITSTNGEVVNLTYSSFAIKQDATYSQSDYIKYKTSSSTVCDEITEGGTATRSQRQDISSLLLSSIESDLERVDFIPQSTERLDLEGGRALASIKVWSKQTSTFVDEYQFTYAYSTAVSGNEVNFTVYDGYKDKRLKLTALDRKPTPTSKTQHWAFQYNSQNLPSRRSLAQDHWGYYNGHLENTTLLPPIHITVPNAPFTSGFMPSMHEIGGNREPDGTTMQAELLNGITYPTGGSSSFTYQPNTATTTEEVFRDTTLALDLSLQANSNPFTTTKTLGFSVSKGEYVRLSLDSYISPAILADRPEVNVNASVLNSVGQQIGMVSSSTYTSSNLNLPAGTYTLRISTNVIQADITGSSIVTGAVTFSYQYSKGVKTYNKLVGGLRIANIEDYDGVNSATKTKRNFQYYLPFVINPVALSDYYTELEESTYLESSSSYCYYSVNTRSSSSKYSFGSIQGGAVGYGKVITRYGDNAENGSTVTVFSNDPDPNQEASLIFPYPPATNVDWRRGLVRSETHYKNGDPNPVSRSINTYEFPSKLYISCFKAGYANRVPTCNDPYGYCGIQRMFYSMVSEHVQKKSTINSQFFFNGSTLDSLSTITNYYYDNSASTNPVRTESFDSSGKLIKTLAYTPRDKSSITNLTTQAAAAIDSMISRNMVEIPLDVIKYTSGVQTQRSLTYFKQVAGLLVPDKILIKNADGPLEERATFSRYDTYGNIVEQYKSNDVVYAYVWGYKGTRLIAEIKNATYQDVINVLGQTALDALNSAAPGTDAAIRQTIQTLRSSSTLQNAQVTGFTYSPVGMTSATDKNNVTTYYSFDDFGRLNSIRDNNSNTLKSFNYHYKGQ